MRKIKNDLSKIKVKKLFINWFRINLPFKKIFRITFKYFIYIWTEFIRWISSIISIKDKIYLLFVKRWRGRSKLLEKHVLEWHLDFSLEEGKLELKELVVAQVAQVLAQVIYHSLKNQCLILWILNNSH